MKEVKKHIHMEGFDRPTPTLCKVGFARLDVRKDQVGDWLEGDKRERDKQRHTAMRMFNQLVEGHPHFDGFHRLIAAYVAMTGGGSEFYMSLEHIRGEAQVDFGKSDFYDGNVRRQGCYLNISFPHSNAGYLQLFRGQNM